MRRTGQVSLDRPGSGKWTSSFFGTRYCATGWALLTSTAKPTACTAECELVLHNENFLATASDSWRMDTAAFLAQNGFAATAPRSSQWGPTFGVRATTVCGGLGKLARARLRMGYIWCAFWTTRGQSSSFLLRRAKRPRLERYEVCLLYTSPSPRDLSTSRMPSSA